MYKAMLCKKANGGYFYEINGLCKNLACGRLRMMRCNQVSIIKNPVYLICSVHVPGYFCLWIFTIIY